MSITDSAILRSLKSKRFANILRVFVADILSRIEELGLADI
jgi:hypothetical protein